MARAAGIGAKLRLKVGGKLPRTPAAPLEVEGIVASFHPGTYTESQPRHGGQTGGDMGPVAIVETDCGLTLMLMTQRGGPNASVQPILACGLDPADFDIIIIKGVHAPVGAYGEVCGTLIRVNTPGGTAADMESIEYRHRRKPLFPFESLESAT
jgi:microcystin degradation protein MlrC